MACGRQSRHTPDDLVSASQQVLGPHVVVHLGDWLSHLGKVVDVSGQVSRLTRLLLLDLLESLYLYSGLDALFEALFGTQPFDAPDSLLESNQLFSADGSSVLLSDCIDVIRVQLKRHGTLDAVRALVSGSIDLVLLHDVHFDLIGACWSDHLLSMVWIVGV